MKMPIILLYAGAYEFVDEKSGEVKRGVSCSYYMNTRLESAEVINGVVGLRPSKASFDPLMLQKVYKAPAIYDAEFEMTVDSKGKTILKIVDMDYVSDAVIQPMEPKDKAQPQKAG